MCILVRRFWSSTQVGSLFPVSLSRINEDVLAKNPTNKPIIGISSYNITPFQAAYYFNKIQCFCFEEQILDPGKPSLLIECFRLVPHSV